MLIRIRKQDRHSLLKSVMLMSVRFCELKEQSVYMRYQINKREYVNLMTHCRNSAESYDGKRRVLLEALEGTHEYFEDLYTKVSDEIF